MVTHEWRPGRVLSRHVQEYLDRRPHVAGAGAPISRLRAVDPPLDVDLCLRIAEAYDAAPLRSDDRRLARQYHLLRSENLEQYELIRRAGIRVRPWLGPGQPYRESRDLVERVTRTRTLFVYLTENGHGPDSGHHRAHPMTGPSGVTCGGVALAHNDIFRAVHDIFGHVMFGTSFGPRGELKSTYCHLQLYPEAVHPVVFTEQVGQICWFFYGPHTLDRQGRPLRPGEPGYLPPARRPYPEQKVCQLDRCLLDRFKSTFDVKELT